MTEPVAPLPDRYRILAPRIALIATSYERLIGKPLVVPGDDPVCALWHAPQAIVAHGTEDDPLFFFGNAVALAAFEASLDTFIGMPSRYSAEIVERAARQTLLDRVSHHGFIDDYTGVRITVTGRRFTIEDAVVWNLIDAAGVRHGQAACFTH